MPETTGALPAIDSRRIIEECVEFARRNGQSAVKIDQMDRRATPRMLFTHHLRYCADSALSEEHTKPAYMLNISLGGMALCCGETLTPGMEAHVRLSLLDGRTAWIKGRVVYCNPDVEHYRAGIAFILDQD